MARITNNNATTAKVAAPKAAPKSSNPKASKPTPKTTEAKPKASESKPKKEKAPAVTKVVVPGDMLECISEAMETMASKDKEFAKKYNSSSKTIEDACRYLIAYHEPKKHEGKSAFAFSSNEDDHELARQFFMDDSIEVPKMSGKVETNLDNDDADDDNDCAEAEVAETPAPKLSVGKKHGKASYRNTSRSNKVEYTDTGDLFAGFDF